MNCLVTGATGFVGRELCRALLERGDTLTALSHSGGRLADGTPTLALDLAEEEVAVRHLEGIDVVFHLAGIAHQHAADSAYEKVNHRATLALAEAACLAGVKHFIFLSSVKAMGLTDGDQPRNEAQCARPEDAYGLSKWQAEEGLRARFSNAAMGVSIIRPALVYAAQPKGNLALLDRGVALGLPRPPPDGARSMVSLTDLVSLLCLLSLDERRGLATWIATDGEAYSTQGIYDLLCTKHGRKPSGAWCPRWCWRLGAALLDLVGPGSESNWNKLFGTELYTNAAVLRDTGWKPALRLADALTPEAVR
jgi:UDP-N-acetyl-alpha-D-quinovosamine dehydrogenase